MTIHGFNQGNHTGQTITLPLTPYVICFVQDLLPSCNSGKWSSSIVQDLVLMASFQDFQAVNNSARAQSGGDQGSETGSLGRWKNSFKENVCSGKKWTVHYRPDMHTAPPCLLSMDLTLDHEGSRNKRAVQFPRPSKLWSLCLDSQHKVPVVFEMGPSGS